MHISHKCSYIKHLLPLQDKRIMITCDVSIVRQFMNSVKWPCSPGVLIAQWIECLPRVWEVMGSIPVKNSESAFSLVPCSYRVDFSHFKICYDFYTTKKSLYCRDCNWVACVTPAPGHWQRAIKDGSLKTCVCLWEVYAIRLHRRLVWRSDITSILNYSTTIFIDMWLWKTKHPWKHFQNFCQSWVLSTDQIKTHQSQPLVRPSDLFYLMIAGCDWCGFQSDLSITCMIDGNFENASATVLFLKVAYQRKWW